MTLFNNDLLFVVGSVIVGGIFTYTFYNNIFTPLHDKSLINTNSSLDTLSNIQLNKLPNHNYVDASVQTTNIQLEAGVQATNTYVESGMQTSARMWYEYIKNWIDEYLKYT